VVFLFLQFAIQNDRFRSVTHTLMLSSDEKPMLSLCDLHGARILLRFANLTCSTLVKPQGGPCGNRDAGVDRFDLPKKSGCCPKIRNFVPFIGQSHTVALDLFSNRFDMRAQEAIH
jgi:hypothetical protein